MHDILFGKLVNSIYWYTPANWWIHVWNEPKAPRLSSLTRNYLNKNHDWAKSEKDVRSHSKVTLKQLVSIVLIRKPSFIPFHAGNERSFVAIGAFRSLGATGIQQSMLNCSLQTAQTSCSNFTTKRHYIVAILS